MQLHIQAAGVTDWLALCVSAPQSGDGGMAVGTGQSDATGGRQPSLGLDQWPVDAVHLVVESAGIAQVVTRAVSPP